MKVFEDEEAPLNLANAMNALRGFDRLSKSAALLRPDAELLLPPPIEAEEGPFRKAGELSMRGWSS